MRFRPALPMCLTLLLVTPGVWAASGARAAKGKGAAPKQAATTSKPAPSSASGKTTRTRKTGRRSRRRDRGQKAPTPERITEIQQALAKDGSFSGKPNGTWDNTTIEAMRKFQEAHGLNPSGKLDALTLQKLGLGSTTAGVAPPLPPVSSSSAATPNGTPSAKRD